MKEKMCLTFSQNRHIANKKFYLDMYTCNNFLKSCLDSELKSNIYTNRLWKSRWICSKHPIQLSHGILRPSDEKLNTMNEIRGDRSTVLALKRKVGSWDSRLWLNNTIG